MVKGKSRTKKAGRSRPQSEEEALLDSIRVKPTTPLAKLVCGDDDNAFRDFVEILGTEAEAVNINEQDKMGMSALFFAVCYEKTEKVKILLDNNADPNLQDNMCGATPLYYATGRYPNVAIARMLIDGGANVNQRSNRGATALHGACLAGNLDCIKLLIKHGADSRGTDCEGVTPLDLAKDDETREILHKKNRREDENLEKMGEACKCCHKTQNEAGVKLSKCAACRAVMYCSKECQRADWKNGHKISCEGYVIGYPGDIPCAFATNISRVYGAQQPTVSLHEMVFGEEDPRAKALKNKRFVVKVQIPLGGGRGDMSVYNEDRSINFTINSSRPGYFRLMDKIRKEGYMGLKGYFWAERSGEPDGGVKVFHGKLAPMQRW